MKPRATTSNRCYCNSVRARNSLLSNTSSKRFEGGKGSTYPPGNRQPPMDLARNLRVECVSRLHPRAPLCIEPGQTVAEAVKLMRKERVGCLLVCASKRLMGIFTERDLMRRVLATHLPLHHPLLEVMTPNPVVVHFNQPIGAAVRLMEE